LFLCFVVLEISLIDDGAQLFIPSLHTMTDDAGITCGLALWTGGELVEMGITCTCGCQFVRSRRAMFCYVKMAVVVHMTAIERRG
jgi:hypothetical protein